MNHTPEKLSPRIKTTQPRARDASPSGIVRLFRLGLTASIAAGIMLLANAQQPVR